MALENVCMAGLAGFITGKGLPIGVLDGRWGLPAMGGTHRITAVDGQE
jgi:hypothetical protein